jgi:hypothetical protein
MSDAAPPGAGAGGAGDEEEEEKEMPRGASHETTALATGAAAIPIAPPEQPSASKGNERELVAAG